MTIVEMARSRKASRKSSKRRGSRRQRSSKLRSSRLRKAKLRSSRRQRGGATLDVAEDYPWASVTTLNEEGVPQTQSVSTFKEMGRDDADPDAPAVKQGLNA